MSGISSSFECLDVTNKCVVVCNLQNWQWRIIDGTEDVIGDEIAEIVTLAGVDRIDDFGGVSKSFLCNGNEYLENPPKILGNAGIFSFTPKNRIIQEGMRMAASASKSGYKLLILTVQKHGKFGKVWVLSALLKSLKSRNASLTYYEDTGSIVDELKEGAWGNLIKIVHVQAPGFEEYISQHADRVISQDLYKNEVLSNSSKRK